MDAILQTACGARQLVDVGDFPGIFEMPMRLHVDGKGRIPIRRFRRMLWARQRYGGTEEYIVYLEEPSTGYVMQDDIRLVTASKVVTNV